MSLRLAQLLTFGFCLCANAGPRRAVLAVGNCEDGELVGLAGEVSQALVRARGPDALVSEETVRVTVGSPEASSPEELKQSLKGIQTLFYNGALNRADDQLDALLREIGRLPPGPDQVALAQQAHVLRAMTLRNLERSALADDELRAALRIDPDFTLDPHEYSPTLRVRLDKLRRELLREPREELRVTSDPPGARVFLDGRDIGKTPLQQPLPLTTYHLVLSLNGRRTFPRTITLQKEKPVSLWVDAEFEASVDARRFPCTQEAAAALKLATLVEADEAVLVRLGPSPADRLWMTASVINVQTAQRLREGGIKIERNSQSRSAAVEELANFVFTGQRGQRVLSLQATHPNAPVASLPTNPPPATSGRTWRTPVGIGAVVLGGAAATVGIVFAFRSASSWGAFNAYYAPPGQAPTPDQLPGVAAIRQQAETERTIAIVGLGVAAAAGTAGTLLLALDGRPTGPPRVTVRPVLGVGTVGLVGTLP